MDPKEAHPFTEYLDPDFKLWCAWDDAPTEEEIVALEERLGRKLPAQYRAFLGKYGGTMLEVRESAWPRPEIGKMAPAWAHQYAFFVFGIGKGIPDWLNVEVVTEKFLDLYRDAVGEIPFFKQITSDVYLSFGKDGRIYRWAPDTDEVGQPVEESFDQIIVEATKVLAQDKEKRKEQS